LAKNGRGNKEEAEGRLRRNSKTELRCADAEGGPKSDKTRVTERILQRWTPAPCLSVKR